jgi:hypothetical protein
MKTNIVSVFILITTFGISSQNVIRIQENIIGEFSLYQVYLTDSILQNGLSREFTEKKIKEPYTVNNVYLIDIKRTGKKNEVKITPVLLYKDFSQSCIGYFQIQKYLLFIQKGSYKKLFKKTRKIKRFNFYETVLVETNGITIKSPKGRAPTFYIYELTKNSFEFKEKIILN